MTTGTSQDLAAQVGANLPYLRRYARALTGTQSRGDQYAMATLEAILADPQTYDAAVMKISKQQ